MMQIKYINNRFLPFLPYVIFFTGSFIFFGFFADYIGFYQEKQSLFVLSCDYLSDNIKQPGSLLKYIGIFLTTFSYYKFAGALIISLTICLIICFISKIISFLSDRESLVLPFILGTAYFVIQTKYQYLFYNNLGVLLQLVLFYLTVRYLKGFIPVIIFPIWYWITGGFAWIFALMYSFFLIRNSIKKGWPKIITLFLLSFFSIYLLKEFFIFQTIETLLTFPFSDEDTGSQFRFFILLTVFIILIPFISRIKIKTPVRISNSTIAGPVKLAVLPLLMIVTSSILCSDKTVKEYFYAEKLFYQEKYHELTSFLLQHPTTNRLTIYLNNVALCETGRLNDLLFHFPQSPDGQTLFLKWEMFGEVLKRGGYFYYTTGMINEAHRWAYENMVMKGTTPEGLKMLIKTEIINGNYKVASKYISILKNTFFYSKEAGEFAKLLYNEDAVNSHPELGVKRKEKIGHDFFSITDDPYVNIERVLSHDPLSLKAYEYKLAYLMLTEDYKEISIILKLLEKTGYKKIPVHTEEAAMVCKISDAKLNVDFENLKINPQTEARFNQFLQTFQFYGNNLKSAQPILKQKFGNTFWYYAFYH